MIKAKLAFADLDNTPCVRDGVLRIGASHVAAHSHPALEWHLVTTHDQWFCVIRERAGASGLAEPTAHRSVEIDEFHRLYREALLWPLDYLLVEGAQKGRRLKLQAGPLGIAPVFCRTTPDGVVLSYDFADFLGTPSLIDLEIASRRLALHTDYSASQLCCGITLLTERSVLHLGPDHSRYVYPSPFAFDPPSTSVLDDHGVKRFEALLTNAVRARPMLAANIALELSGGMDSAAVACAVSALHGPVTSLGVLLDGASLSAQVDRRRRIARQLALPDTVIDIGSYPPILDLRRTSDRPEYPQPEFYLEAFERIWDIATKQGRTFLFRGLGGDELLPLFQDEPGLPDESDDSIFGKAKRWAARLMTPKAREASRAVPCMKAPTGPLQPSVLLSNVCQAPHLLARGLWPVSPLSDLTLVNYCRSLPLACRRERETIRQYLRSRLGEVFMHGYAKETFANVLPLKIAEQSETLAAQLRDCALADLGLVDPKAALELLSQIAATHARELTAPFITFLWLERFVRQFR